MVAGQQMTVAADLKNGLNPLPVSVMGCAELLIDGAMRKLLMEKTRGGFERRAVRSSSCGSIVDAVPATLRGLNRRMKARNGGEVAMIIGAFRLHCHTGPSSW